MTAAHRLVADGLNPAVEDGGLVEHRRHVARLAQVEGGHGRHVAAVVAPPVVLIVVAVRILEGPSTWDVRKMSVTG